MKTTLSLAGAALAGALALLVACCAQKPPQSATPPAVAGGELSDAELAKMSQHQLAQYIFEHNGCNSCHTLSAQGQLGYTARGRQALQHSEGCVHLLTAVQVIAQKPPSEWTPQERMTAERFQEFGCTACHQIEQGKLVPTPLGEKLGNLHMSCPTVMHLLSSNSE